MTQWATANGKGAAEIDTRYVPALITTWWGTADRTVVDHVFDALDEELRRAKVAGQKVVTISYMAQPGMPDAVTRKRMAERAEQTNQRFGSVSVGSIIVLESKISRAALQAVNWLTGSGDTGTVVGTLDEGFDLASRLLEDAGEGRPRLPAGSDYQPKNPLADVG